MFQKQKSIYLLLMSFCGLGLNYIRKPILICRRTGNNDYLILLVLWIFDEQAHYITCFQKPKPSKILKTSLMSNLEPVES